MSAGRRKQDYGALAARQVQRELAAAATGPDRFERAAAVMAGPATCLDLDAIQARTQSTREIDEGHVQALTDSIGALGMIEPVVVDRAHRLLAGGHRLAAARALRESSPEAFAKWFATGIPVRVLDFDADEARARALEIEVAENEHRRDYTTHQVKELVERLKAAGYRDTVGRPKGGEKALGPALESVVGKSMKTIRKLLQEGEGGAPPPKAPATTLAGVMRALTKQRPFIPEGLVPQFEALLHALEVEQRSQEADVR